MANNHTAQTAKNGATQGSTGDASRDRGESGRPEAPTPDDVYEVLSNRRRRYALHHLKQLEGEQPVSLSEVSTQVAAWENGSDPEQLGYSDRKNVHTSLHQFHAPKMDDLGVVNFDRSRGTVELTEYGQGVDVYLEAVYGHQIPWATYFLLLSGIMTSVAFGVWADAAPFGVVDGGVWVLFVAVSFLVSSVAYAYVNRSMRVGADGPPPELAEE
jgi:hypothetical protein